MRSAQALGGLARAGLLGVQRIALDDQAVQGSRFLRFGLTQRRQEACSLSLHRRGVRGAFATFADGGGSGGQSFFGGTRAQLGRGPAQAMRQRLGLADMAGEVAIARGLSRLALEARELAFDLADDVFEPAEIGLGCFQAKLRLVAALVQAGDAGSLFEDRTAA